MCRHLGYLGPRIRLAELVTEPEHGLLHQAYAPADMRGGATINADGFGVGWWYEGSTARYRRTIPIWTDENLSQLCQVIDAGAVLAAVRSATPGMPVTEAACAPFTDGNWLFSHNGVVTGWPDSLATLAEELPGAELLRMAAPTDSALLWSLLLPGLAAGTDPRDALAALVEQVEERAPGSRLNLMLCDGERLYATAWRHSLSILATPEFTTMASEPYDGDPRWQPVPDGTIVAATRGTLRHYSITGET